MAVSPKQNGYIASILAPFKVIHYHIMTKVTTIYLLSNHPIYEPPAVTLKTVHCVIYCIYAFCMILTINSNYFHKGLLLTGLSNGHGLCSLGGRN